MTVAASGDVDDGGDFCSADGGIQRRWSLIAVGAARRSSWFVFAMLWCPQFWSTLVFRCIMNNKFFFPLPTPVYGWVVPSRAFHHGYLHMKTLVLGVDHTSASDRAVEIVASLARQP